MVDVRLVVVLDNRTTTTTTTHLLWWSLLKHGAICRKTTTHSFLVRKL